MAHRGGRDIYARRLVIVGNYSFGENGQYWTLFFCVFGGWVLTIGRPSLNRYVRRASAVFSCRVIASAPTGAAAARANCAAGRLHITGSAAAI